MQLQQSARPALALFGLLALSAVALLCYHAPGDGPTFARKISGMFANMTGVDDESGHILPANVVQTVAEQKVHAALSVEEISAMWLKNAESVRAPTAVMAVQATMLEAPPPPPPPFEDKTMGELNTEVARLKDAIDVKTDTLSKTPNGDERNSLKLDVRNMKEQKSAMKAAFKRKKESAPVLLKTAGGERIPSNWKSAESLANISAACTSKGGNVTDDSKSMCCGSECDECGVAQKDLAANATDLCSKTAVRATKVCTPDGTLPCMVKFIPTEESKAQQLAYDTEQGLVTTDMFGHSVQTSFGGESSDPWYSRVAASLSF